MLMTSFSHILMIQGTTDVPTGISSWQVMQMLISSHLLLVHLVMSRTTIVLDGCCFWHFVFMCSAVVRTWWLAQMVWFLYWLVTFLHYSISFINKSKNGGDLVMGITYAFQFFFQMCKNGCYVILKFQEWFEKHKIWTF